MAWYVDGLRATKRGHLVAPESVVPAVKSSREDAELYIGSRSVVQGPIRHAGAVVLGRDTVVWAGIEGGHEVVVGAGSTVRGPITSTGRIVIQHGAVVHGDLSAGSDVMLLGDSLVGDVTAAGDIVIVGAPQTGTLKPGGRVQTRPW